VAAPYSARVRPLEAVLSRTNWNVKASPVGYAVPARTVRQSWRDEVTGPPESAAVLIAGDNAAHLEALRVLLENEGHRVLTARLASEAHVSLRQSEIDLVLLEMCPAALDLCRGMRSNRRTALTPVLMLTSDQSPAREIECIASGADSVLGWPFDSGVLCARVGSMLRRQAGVDALEDSEMTLAFLAQAVDERDNLTASHCNRMSPLCVAMGMAMGLSSEHLLVLHRGGYMHDIGKIGIPDAILSKAGPLDEEEWRVMRTHTTKGEEMCRPMKSLTPVLPIIRSHHERWDGSGYPDGLKGRDIPLLARVVQLADIYDALTSPRAYKPGRNSADALRIMQEETDRGWRDPELVSLFLLLRHEDVQNTNPQTRGWREPDAMIESLQNLRSSILRY